MTRQIVERGKTSADIPEDLRVRMTVRLCACTTQLMDGMRCLRSFTDQALTLGPSGYWVRGSLHAAGCLCLRR
jgi:hypothetical protein